MTRRRMQIKSELKAPVEQPAEPAAAAEPVDSEEEAETREAAVLEEMQVPTYCVAEGAGMLCSVRNPTGVSDE
jgi:hypothetical protein